MKTVSSLTTAELVAEYNLLTGKSITRFASRAAGEKQVSSARANASIDKSKFVKPAAKAAPVVEKKAWKVEDGCPKCHTKEDQTMAGLEGTTAGETRMFCHHCSTEYFMDTGKIYKAPAASVDRSKSISESWSDPEVAAKRARRDHVQVAGQIYSSVLEAFKSLNLPQSAHIKFRMALKAEGKKLFEFGNKKYEFALVPKTETK